MDVTINYGIYTTGGNIMKTEEIVSKELFYKLYIDDNLTIAEIANQYNIKTRALESLNYKKYHIVKSKDKIEEAKKRLSMEKYGVDHPQQLKEVKEKAKQTCLDKYGVDCSSKNELVKEKAKQTCLDKYGVENAGWTIESQEKIKATNMERYGVENPFSNKNIQEKIKSTIIERYGVEHALQNDNIKQKMIDKNIEKYGVSWPASTTDVKTKRKKTNIQKYGGPSSMCSKEIREKAKKTNLEKYGVEHVLQNDDIKQKMITTNIQKYGVKSTLSLEDVKEKIKQTCIDKYGVDYFCMADACKNKSRGKASVINENFATLLNNNNIIFSREYPINNRSYDFKVDDILIEMNPTATHNSTWGIHSKNGMDPNYHFEKSKLAEENNFRCIHIFDWDNQTKILSLLQTKTQIYARQCNIKELKDDDEYRNFINTNHIQGYCKGNKIILGLYYNNELVELMSFGTPRYNKKYKYELLRLCSKANYAVVGGTNKLFKYFINHYDPENIISYCDNAKFAGDIYKQLGFCLKSSGKPSKHWYNMKTKQHITDNLLRQRGYDQLFNTNYGKGTSNEELMLQNGFVEIYDCGQSTYVYKRED